MRVLKWRLMETPPDDGGGGGGGDAGGESGGDDGAAAPETVSKAKEMGWAPRDQWRGNPENWLDAGEFVKRGETFVPFLQRERKNLKGELSARDQRIAQLESQLAETNTQIKGITEFNAEMAKDRQERRKAEIGTEIKAAREAGDDVRVAELTNELGDVVKTKTVTPPATPTPPGPPQPPASPQIQPWVKTYIDTNEDFFNDPRRVALFNVEVLEKRKAGDARVGETDGVAFLNEAKAAVDRMFGGNPRRQAPSKNEGSNTGGNGAGGGGGVGGKTYAQLPADARAKCDTDEQRFVGAGKLFKDQAAWRKHYVSEYFGPSATAMSRTMEG